MMSSNFWKIKTSNLNSDPGFFNLIKLRPILPATYFFNTFKTGKSPTTETDIRGFSKFPLENVSKSF